MVVSLRGQEYQIVCACVRVSCQIGSRLCTLEWNGINWKDQSKTERDISSQAVLAVN